MTNTPVTASEPQKPATTPVSPSPTPQQNQGDNKSANKPNEQQK